MATNEYELWQVFTNHSLAVFKNKLSFLKNVHKDKDYLFGKTGMKSGTEINLRKAIRTTTRRGEKYIDQGYKATSVPVRVQELIGVDLDVPSQEWVLNMEDTKRNIIEPSMAQLANAVEFACLQMAARGTSNSSGTFNTAISTTAPITRARSILTNEAAPDGQGRRMMINPNTNETLVPALQGLFNPAGKIGKQYETGVIGGETLGFHQWNESANMPYHTVGPLGGTPAVDGAGQSGNAINLKGWTAAAGLRLRQGDLIRFAGSTAINPLNRSTYGLQREFTVLQDHYSDSAGKGTVYIAEKLIAAPDAYSTVDGLPADSALVDVFKTAAAGQSALAGTTTGTNLAYHGDAYVFASIKQFVPKNSKQMAWEAIDPDSGTSIRYIQDFDTRENVILNRFDVSFAFGVAYSNFGVRVFGQ